MKLKLISDGTTQGTKVVDIKSGEMIENVYHIRWELTTGGKSMMILDLVDIPAEVIGHAEEDTHE